MSRLLPRHDHEGIRQICRELELTMADERIQDFFEAVDLLFHTLLTHIRAEDSAMGFYHEVEHKIPRLQYTVRDLRQEHQVMLNTLDHLRSLSKEDFPKAKELMKNCLAVLHRHERREDDLIHEAFYLDVGSPGA